MAITASLCFTPAVRRLSTARRVYSEAHTCSPAPPHPHAAERARTPSDGRHRREPTDILVGGARRAIEVGREVVHVGGTRVLPPRRPCRSPPGRRRVRWGWTRRGRRRSSPRDPLRWHCCGRSGARPRGPSAPRPPHPRGGAPTPPATSSPAGGGGGEGVPGGMSGAAALEGGTKGGYGHAAIIHRGY
eukprot:1178479-Prorocentrum_minimum.AAC.2